MEKLELMKVPELLRLYSSVLTELERRGVVRSMNNPVADFAEYLVVRGLGLTRAEKSTKGYDAVDDEGRHYEIKGRRPTAKNKSRMLSAIRDCDAAHFQYLAGVLFNEDFSLLRACLIPFDIVRAEARYRKHVNAHILELRDSLWQRQGVVDISEKIRSVIKSEGEIAETAVQQQRKPARKQ